MRAVHRDFPIRYSGEADPEPTIAPPASKTPAAPAPTRGGSAHDAR
jgi:hypothetical protein